jgi:Ca2+/H+ antiporter, TMEM165/GDT1 family
VVCTSKYVLAAREGPDVCAQSVGPRWRLLMWNWAHAGPTAAAAFLASLVEFVEALTVVLAVGTVRGWRHALTGAGLGLLALAGLVAVLGPALARVPLTLLQLVVGALLLLFGLRWLRKAILRCGGVIALHDEGAAFARETATLRATGKGAGAWDRVAIAAAFQIVILEGVEVVFIVIALSAAGQLLLPAVAGAGGALAVVIALGLLLHRPLAQVPENALKFAVGVLLSAFGTFWAGEGIGLKWPGADGSIALLIAAYLALALVLVPLVRRLCPAAAAGAAL